MGAITEPGLIGMAQAEPMRDIAGQAARLHRWLLAYEARVDALARSLDDGWLERRFGAAAVDAWHAASLVRRRRLLQVWIGRPVPTVAGLMMPANRVALLEAADLRLVLQARALFARATALRRCVDGRLLDRIAAGLGVRGAGILLGLQRCAGRQSEAEDIELLADGAPEDWARDGLSRFARDEAWTEPALKALVHLSLPPAAAGIEGRAATSASLAFIELVPLLIPETSWLFG